MSNIKETLNKVLQNTFSEINPKGTNNSFIQFVFKFRQCRIGNKFGTNSSKNLNCVKCCQRGLFKLFFWEIMHLKDNNCTKNNSLNARSNRLSLTVKILICIIYLIRLHYRTFIHASSNQMFCCIQKCINYNQLFPTCRDSLSLYDY